MLEPVSDAPDETESATEVPPEVILLSLPATGPFGRIARMSAASLALRRGLSLAAVDDLRLAMDEALILMLGHQDHTGSIDLRFELEANAVAVSFTPRFDDGPPTFAAEDLERFTELAGPLLTDFAIDESVSSLRLSKSATNA